MRHLFTCTAFPVWECAQAHIPITFEPTNETKRDTAFTCLIPTWETAKWALIKGFSKNGVLQGVEIGIQLVQCIKPFAAKGLGQKTVHVKAAKSRQMLWSIFTKFVARAFADRDIGDNKDG